MPRAWLVPASGLEEILADDAQLNRIKESGFDPNRNVVTAENSVAPVTPSTATVMAGPPVRVTSSNTNTYEFSFETTANSVLVVSQSYYPGWRAAVDGVPTPVFRADYALTGVAVPAGHSKVRLIFDPALFKECLAVSALSLLILLALVFLKSSRSKLSELPPLE
jgi:hypothetical protein